MFDARVVEVLLASPGDVSDERNAALEVIARLNAELASELSVMFMARRWELDAIPELGSDAQAVVNEQIVDRSDVLVAIFWHRLGTPTNRAESGTLEEIERFSAAGKPVHIFVSERPIPSDVDTTQIDRMRDAVASLESQGLVGRFADVNDFKQRLRTALLRDLFRETGATDLPTAPVVQEPEPVLRARVRRTGRTDYRLEITNYGDAPAYNVTVELAPEVQGVAPDIALDGPIRALAPKSSADFPLVVHMGVASRVTATLRWTTDDDPESTSRQFRQSVTIL